tara:strand:+ start:55 stop:915 length:861 start_codon:yes stop_codon:yes gene_type:complete
VLIKTLDYCRRRANFRGKFSGLDDPIETPEGADYWYAYPVQDFDYQHNSWGFRGPEYEQYIGKPVNICLGDSFTVNIGGPIEHSWCSQLAQRFDIPTLNFGMDGAGNDAIKLVYNEVSQAFDVVNCFVMYSYLHRRLVDGFFTSKLHEHEDNVAHFLSNRLHNVHEAAIPSIMYDNKELQLLEDLGIYSQPIERLECFSDQHRSLIDQDTYEILQGSTWPTYKEFMKGAEPHPDMYSEQFGKFVLKTVTYANRDGFHSNKETNKVYADYFYNQWKLKNEPQNITQT